MEHDPKHIFSAAGKVYRIVGGRIVKEYAGRGDECGKLEKKFMARRLARSSHK